MRPIATAALVLFTLSASCSANPWDDPAPAAVSDETIPASVDLVWDALSQVYSFLGMQPVAEVDQRTLSVTSLRRVQVRGGLVGSRDAPLARCSVPRTAERTETGARLGFQSANGIATLSVTTTIAAADEGTRVRSEVAVSTSAVSYPPPARTPNCVTTGRLESDIAEALRSLVSPPDSIPTEPAYRRPF